MAGQMPYGRQTPSDTALASASAIPFLLFPELGALASVLFSDLAGSWARLPIVPAISAGMLPLALVITSWRYPATILVGTGGLALLAVLRSRLAPGTIPQLHPALGHGPISSPWLPLAIFVVGGLLLVQLLGSRLVAYPPLFVICWEMLA